MKILTLESGREPDNRILTKMLVTAHVIGDYRNSNEDGDFPEFEFAGFEHEDAADEVVNELNDWQLPIGPGNEDVAIFKDIHVQDAYFDDKYDGSTGVIKVHVEFYSSNSPSKSDLQSISDEIVEFMMDDAIIDVRGEWSGEEEYWNGVSPFPSYRDAHGELSETGFLTLDTSKPITYTLL